MKNKILSKFYENKSPYVKISKTIHFGDEIDVNLKKYSKVLFELRKKCEFKKKDLGEFLIVNYSSNIPSSLKMKVIFKYTLTNTPNPKQKHKVSYYSLNHGENIIKELYIPIDNIYLDKIIFKITDKKHRNFKIKFNDIYFDNIKEKEL